MRLGPKSYVAHPQGGVPNMSESSISRLPDRRSDDSFTSGLISEAIKEFCNPNWLFERRVSSCICFIHAIKKISSPSYHYEKLVLIPMPGCRVESHSLVIQSSPTIGYD